MYLNICNTYSALSVISLIKSIFLILMIVVPIILIVTITIDLVKITKNPEESNIKKVKTSIIIRVIATFIIFLLPILVSLLTSDALLNQKDYKESSCWINSNTDYLEALKEVEEAEVQAEREKRKQQKELMDGKRSLASETRAKAEATNKAEAEKLRKAEEERLKKEAERYKQTLKSSSGNGSAVIIPGSSLGAKVFNTALAEFNDPEGNVGRANRYTCYLWPNYCPPKRYNKNYHWCAAFVAYVLNKAGAYPTYVTFQSGRVTEYKNYFKQKGQWELSAGHGGSYIPVAGDVIIFDDNHDPVNGGSHIGIVEGTTGGNVYFVDGNANDRIKHRHYKLNIKYIIGYGAWQK